MATNKLSALQVTKQVKPGRYGDGGGLWLQVSTRPVFGDKAEAAYRRGDLSARRRTLMEAWATFCRSAS